MRHGWPCGHYTDPRRECRCSPRQIETCRRRISSPLTDCIDIHLDVPPVMYPALVCLSAVERSGELQERDASETQRP